MPRHGHVTSGRLKKRSPGGPNGSVSKHVLQRWMMKPSNAMYKKLNPEKMKIKVLLFLVLCFVMGPPAGAEDLESLLPGPTGRYKVATSKLFLVDSTRRETFVLGRKPRELYVKLWYPVASEIGRAHV